MSCKIIQRKSFPIKDPNWTLSSGLSSPPANSRLYSDPSPASISDDNDISSSVNDDEKPVSDIVREGSREK